jgi:hypothetical protein
MGSEAKLKVGLGYIIADKCLQSVTTLSQFWGEGYQTSRGQKCGMPVIECVIEPRINCIRSSETRFALHQTRNETLASSVEPFCYSTEF